MQNSSIPLIIEGMTSLSALIRATNEGVARRRIIKVYIDRDLVTKDKRRVAFLYESAKKIGFGTELSDRSIIDGIARGKTHGGIIAEVTEAEYPDVSLLKPSGHGFSFLCEGIEDPYTLAHSIRSLYLCGAESLILPGRFPFSADALIAKASAGTSELLPVFTGDPLQAVEKFASYGYMIAAAGIREAVDCDKAELRSPLLLIVGGEKRGISGALSKKCETVLKIPYARDFKASLPTESSVSILAYELSRRQRTPILRDKT